MSDSAAPHGFTIRRSTSEAGRGYVRVTASDGRAVSFYDDGDVRLIREGLIVNLRDAHPGSGFVEFVRSNPEKLEGGQFITQMSMGSQEPSV